MVILDECSIQTEENSGQRKVTTIFKLKRVIRTRRRARGPGTVESTPRLGGTVVTKKPRRVHVCVDSGEMCIQCYSVVYNDTNSVR